MLSEIWAVDRFPNETRGEVLDEETPAISTDVDSRAIDANPAAARPATADALPLGCESRL